MHQAECSCCVVTGVRTGELVLRACYLQVVVGIDGAGPTLRSPPSAVSLASWLRRSTLHSKAQGFGVSTTLSQCW